MGTETLPPLAQTQARLYALQAVVGATLVRLFEDSDDIEGQTKELLDIAMGSIQKFDFYGENTEDQINVARAIMEAFATETVTAAAQSGRLRLEVGD